MHSAQPAAAAIVLRAVSCQASGQKNPKGTKLKMSLTSPAGFFKIGASGSKLSSLSQFSG